VERFHRGIQGTGFHSAIQGDGEIGGVSGGSVLACVLKKHGGAGRTADPLLLSFAGKRCTEADGILLTEFL
jgi:hypothetical protein